jgi:integrase
MAREPYNHDATEASDLSRVQIDTLLSYVQERANQGRCRGTTRTIVDEMIVLILLHAGLRAEELCGLRIADTPAHHGRTELHICGAAGKATRVVFIPEELVPTFRRFVQLYRKGAGPSDPLLLSERGTPFSYMSLYSKVRRIGQEAGVPGLHPATLRHVFLVRLYEKEQDLRLVQEQAGHVRVKSTASHVRPRSATERCEACGKPVAPGRGGRIDSGQLLCPNCLSDLRSR